MTNMRHQRRRKGGFLPLLAAGIPLLIGAVSGALDIARKAKQLKNGTGMHHYASARTKARRAHRRRGGRVMAHRRHHNAKRRARGRGFVSDLIGGIPLLGSFLGPLASKIGLGLSNVNTHRLPYTMGHRGGRLTLPGVRGGLLSAAGAGMNHMGCGKRRHMRRAHHRHVRVGHGVKRVLVHKHRVGGYLAPTWH